MVELTLPYENRMEGVYIYEREKYLNLTKELRDARSKAVAMPVEVGAKGFIGSFNSLRSSDQTLNMC